MAGFQPVLAGQQRGACWSKVGTHLTNPEANQEERSAGLGFFFVVRVENP